MGNGKKRRNGIELLFLINFWQKWTDNAGLEKYTTEVVLGNFKGELTMLDGRNESDAFSGGGEMSPPDQDYVAGSTNDVGSALSNSDLDDEIPF